MIQLSWFIFTGLILLTNSFAYGIEALIYAPFGSPDNFTFSSLFSSIGGSDIQTLFVGLAAGVAGAALGGGLFMVALAAFVILIVGALALVTRRIMIIMFLVMSPLALAAWILPNTERFWKLWWDNFSKLLLMYPIILAMIAAGRVFAKVGAGSSDEVISTLIVLGGVFIPLAMIPKTFSMAGGAFTAIGGSLAQRGAGMNKQLMGSGRKRLGNRWKKRGHRAQEGNLFKGGQEGNLRGRLNRGLEATSKIGKAGFNPRHMRTNMRTAMNDASNAEAAEFGEKNAEFAAFKGDDAKLWGARFTAHDDIAAELARADADRFAGASNATRREEAISQIMRAQRETSHETFQKARVQAQAKTGTGYQDANGNFDASLMMDDINAAWGNDRNGAGAALAKMRGDLTQSGQVAGQAGFGTWAGALEGRYNNIHGLAGGMSAQDAHNTVMDDAIDSSAPQHAIYGKPSSAAAMGAAHARRIRSLAESAQNGTPAVDTGQRDAAGNAILRAATEEDVSAAMAAAAGIYDAVGQASPGNASAMANELMSVQIPTMATVNINGGAPPPTASIREHIEAQMDGNEEFRNRRRDLSASTAERAAAAAAQIQQGGPPGGPPGGAPGGPPGGAPGASDARLKRDINYLGTLPNKIRYYSFRYLWDDRYYVGVMAQEILETNPDAVYVMRNGFYAVNYELLGLRMVDYSEWEKNKSALQINQNKNALK